MTFFIVFGLFSFVYKNAFSITMSNKPSEFMNVDSDAIIADYIKAKRYLPTDLELPNNSIVNNADIDVTYLLSKLSDEELIKLLNDQPKKTEYNINDILKINYNIKNNPLIKSKPKYEQKSSYNFNEYTNRSYLNKRFQTVSSKNKLSGPVFRLEDKEVNPYVQKYDADPKYVAIQTLYNILYSRPQAEQLGDDDDKNELLFDVLISQLKALCCKKHNKRKHVNASKSHQLKSLTDEIIPRGMNNLPTYEKLPASAGVPREYIFLIINDEVKSDGNEEIIYVDPESLKRNSSVLLLGPVTNRMTETELKLVMTHLSNELSKPEYLPLLYQLTDGKLNEENMKLTESFITGPDTRRYIKPHRCNHQSKVAKIYGGPKWLICTGYLNLNAPSLYD